VSEHVERVGAGEIRLRLSREERELLRRLPRELRALVDGRPEAPDLRRLFPPAYEDPDSEAEYRRLTRGELVEGRREALRVLEETVGRDRLTEEDLHAWLGALNDLRLVLGTRLGVTAETYERELDPLDPRAHELAVYAFLTWLQEQVVEALADA